MKTEAIPRLADMSPEQKRVACAAACGWTHLRYASGSLWGYKGNDVRWSAGCCGDTPNVPDYLRDLNACHALEQGLTKDQRHDYVACLWEVLGLKRTSSFWTEENFENAFSFATPTAAQRVDAFLLATRRASA